MLHILTLPTKFKIIDRLVVTLPIVAIAPFLMLMPGCGARTGQGNKPQATNVQPQKPPVNVFDSYMSAGSTPADGFDFALGDADGKGWYTDLATGKRYNGWYIATNFAEQYSLGIHPAEDWNGNGGGNTDLGQDVHAVANGKVIYAADAGRLWGNIVIIEHTFYENQERKEIRSLYAHLHELKVRKGDDVARRQIIATVGQDPDKLYNAHLHLELRWDKSLTPTYWPSSNGKDQAWVREHYASPTDFIKAHRATPVPQREPVLVLVDQTSLKMRIFQSGSLIAEYDISLGQGRGQKRAEGDNKTPVGMYFAVQKHNGTFDGPYGDYYGGHWIRINYPNKYDAERGLAESLITQRDAATISSNWEKRIPTLEKTKLGGGIGFHGWIKEWDNNGPRHLSWGCVVVHISDIDRVYELIKEGSMVVIF